MVHIVTDSTADVPPNLVAELNIKVVPCFIMFGDRSFLDNVTITREQFYDRLTSSSHLPTTAAPGIGMFEEAYRSVAQPGDEIISIHLAATLSGVWNSARLAGELMPPEVRITIYDSNSISMGLGWMVVAAARAARQGKSAAEIVTLLNGMQDRVYVFAALDTMKFLRHSGRVGWARAMIGEILDIKPIVRVHQGVVESAGRVRTRARSLKHMIELVAGLGSLETLAVLHTAMPSAAVQLKDSVTGLVPGAAIPIVEVTPTIGVHVGPNALGLAAVVKDK